MDLILVFTQLFLSKTRVGYVTLNNNDFAALWDCYKVFRLNKKTFQTILASLPTENGIFHHFSTVNKTFWHPIQLFRSKQGFLKIGSVYKILINYF